MEQDDLYEQGPAQAEADAAYRAGYDSLGREQDAAQAAAKAEAEAAAHAEAAADQERRRAEDRATCTEAEATWSQALRQDAAAARTGTTFVDEGTGQVHSDEASPEWQEALQDSVEDYLAEQPACG